MNLTVSAAACDVYQYVPLENRFFLEDRFLRILSDAGLLSGAWRSMPYNDLPKEARDGVDRAIDAIRDHCAEAYYYDW